MTLYCAKAIAFWLLILFLLGLAVFSEQKSVLLTSSDGWSVQAHDSSRATSAYAVCVGFSFLLSKHFVFRSKVKGAWELDPFIGCFASAFILNQIVLYAVITTLGVHPLWAQFGAISVYCISMYLMQRYMVFGTSR